MPDPIKVKANIVGPLTDQHYALLGKILAEWAMIELRLAYAVARFSGAKVRSILFAFQNMTIRAKLDTATAVVAAEVPDDWEGEKTEFLSLIEQARKFSGIRHAAAHSVWLGLTSRGRMVAMDIEARGESPQVGRVAWGVREFEAAVGALHELSEKLQDAGNAYLFQNDSTLFDHTGPDFS